MSTNPSSRPTSSIVILTYNNFQLTRQCLESVYSKPAGVDFETILVDNASQDETASYLKEFAREHQNVKLILNETNTGFARGNNMGAALAEGEYLCFLNNDTVVTQHWLEGMIMHLEDPSVGMVGPVTNSSGNETRIPVDYQSLDDMEDFAQGYTRTHAGEAFEIRMLPFLCVVMRRTVYDEVGPLDERFSQGMFEDDDYALRLREAGYRLLCAEDVFIHHWGGAGFASLGFAPYWEIFQKNREKFEQKWGREWMPTRYRDELLDTQLAQTVQEKIQLASQLVECERLIEAHRQELKQLQRQIDFLDSSHAQAQESLDEIHASDTWKAVQALWRMRVTLAPDGSARERALKTGMRLLKTIWRPLTGIARRLSRWKQGGIKSWRRSVYTRRLKKILADNGDTHQVVVFLPSIEWQVPLFQRPHQLAQSFARQGCLTFFCERHSPLSYPNGFHAVGERLYIANVPFEAFDVVESPVVFALVYNRKDVSHFDRARIVYEYIDELDVFPGEIEELQRIHNWFIHNADLVVATADKLYQQVLPKRPDALLSPNGVDYEFIRRVIQSTDQPPKDLDELVDSHKPIIGYYGALARWFDYPLIEWAAEQRPEYQFVLIGPDYDGSIWDSGLSEYPNLHWLGVKPYPELPRYLKFFDVATIPFVLNKITHSTSPLKLFEYMTGGKPIVTTAMRECTGYPEVLIASDRSDFVAKLDQALNLRYDRPYLERLKRRALENTWDLRVKSILQALSSDEPEKPVDAPE